MGFGTLTFNIWNSAILGNVQSFQMNKSFLFHIFAFEIDKNIIFAINGIDNNLLEDVKYFNKSPSNQRHV